MSSQQTINYKKYYPTAAALYFTYFIHGIGASILGQYKQDFAALWGSEKLADGTFDVSMVLAVIAALGLGRLISLPFSGPISDKFGRKVSGIIGIICYVAYLGGIVISPNMTVGYIFAIIGGVANSFLDTCVSPSCMEIFPENGSIAYLGGIVISPNMTVGYIFAIIGGVANSFLDTCVSPSCMEIFPENGSIANMFTKFSISVAQFLLPFMIGFVASSMLPFKTIFIVSAIAIAIDGLLILMLPFPPKNGGNSEVKSNEPVKKEKMKFTPASIALICIGFTCSSTFMIWLNCNQELGRLYGLADPSKIQSLYAAGTVCAILMSTLLIKKGIKPVKILIIYPAISAAMLLAIYFIKIPSIVLIGGFVLGYSAAGGVLQLCVSTANEMFPKDKGKITSIVMIASSIAN